MGKPVPMTPTPASIAALPRARRRTLLHLPAFAAAALALGIPRAEAAEPPTGRAAIPDLVVYCDPTLRPAMRRIGRLFTDRTRAPVYVFSAPPPLMLAQLDRDVQNDILVSSAATLDEGTRRELVLPATRVAGWRNRLVIAGLSANLASEAPTDVARLPDLLGPDRLAISDDTVASTVNGPAVIERLGLRQVLDGRVVGAADTDEIVFLLVTGTARFGLVHLTDVRANPRLGVVAMVPDTAYAPIVYAAAASRVGRSPSTQAFLGFLGTPDADRRLGLEGLART